MTLLMQNKQSTKLQEATYSSNDLTPRLGYDPLFKFSKEDQPVEIVISTKNFAVVCQHDTSYNYHVSLDKSEDKCISKFLAWARMRRGVKTWKAWQAAGYSLREV